MNVDMCSVVCNILAEIVEASGYMPWSLTVVDIEEHKVSWIETFTISVIAALILAIVSGVTFIAYKHPKGYKRMASTIVLVTCSCFTAVIAWLLGTIHSIIRLLQSKLENSPEKEIRTITSLITDLNDNWTFLFWAIVIFAAIIGYLVFLYYLPDILEEGVKPSNEEKPN